MNSAKPGLLLPSFVLWIALSACGCSFKTEPTTYKEKEISSTIKNICKEEYKVDVATKITPTTIWVYLPLAKIFDKEYGIKKDKLFDEEVMDKLRIIITSIGRVLLSADRTPDFFAVLVSDINIGIDYTIIGNVLDIKKTYAGALPWTESNRRYVFKFNLSPQAIGDKDGRHLVAYNVQLKDFLADQISERVMAEFHEEELQRYFKTERCDGQFNNGKFTFSYLIKETANPGKKIYRDASVYIIQKILKTAVYCIKSYEFRDFSELELVDLTTQDKFALTKAEVWARPTD